MRLDKWVALSGISRKQARKVISAGRVAVDGVVFTDAARVIDSRARVELDGAPISGDTRLHIMLNKPAGVITATDDARERTVWDLLPDLERKRKPNPVGRLDKDVTGLVILTTDGQLAHRLISPAWEVEKVYLARVRGLPDASCARAFEAGVDLGGFVAKPAKLGIISFGDGEALCEVRVTEGKYHQVKRMLSAIGHDVISLHRQSVAGLTLDERLAPGEWRRLTRDEINLLYKIAELDTDE